MKTLREFIETPINEENGRWIKLYPIEDTSEEIKGVRVGNFFEIDNRAYFGNVKEFISKYVCDVTRPYDNYDTARRAMGDRLTGLEVCWVYDPTENTAYITPKKTIKDIK